MSGIPLPEGYTLSTDPTRLDLAMIHGFLTNVYWSKGIPRELVEKMVKNSFCFGVYHTTGQVGFARVITDFASFAYLGDVFILPEHRGKGLSKALMSGIMEHPELQNLRRWMLITVDVHGLYAQFGFKPTAHPERCMEIRQPVSYQPVTSAPESRPEA